MVQLPVLPSAAHQLSSCRTLSHLLPYPELALQGVLKGRLLDLNVVGKTLKIGKIPRDAVGLKKI